MPSTSNFVGDTRTCQRWYDLPFVTEIAAGKIVEAGLGGRITTKPGDFFTVRSFPPVTT